MLFENPFTLELGQNVFILRNGEIFDVYVIKRECSDSLYDTGSATREVFYDVAKIDKTHDNRVFRQCEDKELFKIKKDAARQLLANAGFDCGLEEI